MGKLINLSGQRFGFWVAGKQGKNSKSGQTQWNCICECGKLKLITSNSLRRGNSTSCGCNYAPNLTGERFGKLVVLNQDPCKNRVRRHWVCLCDCGVITIANSYQLKTAKVISCGCSRIFQQLEKLKKKVIMLCSNATALNIKSQTLFDIAKKIGSKIRREDCTPEEVIILDGYFITSSVAGVAKPL